MSMTRHHLMASLLAAFTRLFANLSGTQDSEAACWVVNVATSDVPNVRDRVWVYNTNRPNMGMGGITPAMKLKWPRKFYGCTP